MQEVCVFHSVSARSLHFIGGGGIEQEEREPKHASGFQV